jgi:hypothetical protein
LIRSARALASANVIVDVAITATHRVATFPVILFPILVTRHLSLHAPKSVIALEKHPKKQQLLHRVPSSFDPQISQFPRINMGSCTSESEICLNRCSLWINLLHGRRFSNLRNVRAIADLPERESNGPAVTRQYGKSDKEMVLTRAF